MLKIDIQICFTTIPPHAKFYLNPSKESGVIELRRIPPPRLDRGIERPRIDRVKRTVDLCKSAEITKREVQSMKSAEASVNEVHTRVKNKSRPDEHTNRCGRCATMHGPV